MKKLFFIYVLLSSFLFAQNIHFVVKSDFPKENIWVKKLLQNATKELNKMFLDKNMFIPKTIQINIKKDSRIRAIKANASRGNNSLNFVSNLWQKDKYRIWIMIHELTNLLASYYGSNAYPSDWWSNGRSPFPEYISVKVMQALGLKKEALWRKNVHIKNYDQKFYWRLDKKYSTKVFKKFFSLIKYYNIDLSKVGKKWPIPDKNRSLTTLALLSMAADKNLASFARSHKIGEKPSDWHKRHPSIKFIPYTITNNDIRQEILKIKNYQVQ